MSDKKMSDKKMGRFDCLSQEKNENKDEKGIEKNLFKSVNSRFDNGDWGDDRGCGDDRGNRGCGDDRGNRGWGDDRGNRGCGDDGGNRGCGDDRGRGDGNRFRGDDKGLGDGNRFRGDGFKGENRFKRNRKYTDNRPPELIAKMERLEKEKREREDFDLDKNEFPTL